MRTYKASNINKLIFNKNISNDEVYTIWDYRGINLSDTKQGHGPFTCDLYVCNDFETGKKVQFVEKARYQSLLVVGG